MPAANFYFKRSPTGGDLEGAEPLPNYAIPSAFRH
jgi:hypothetical protein